LASHRVDRRVDVEKAALAFLVVGALFFSAVLLFMAVLGGILSPEISIIGQIIHVYTTWDGPVGVLIKVTWPFMPIVLPLLLMMAADAG
jgi:hypothetical protein